MHYQIKYPSDWLTQRCNYGNDATNIPITTDSFAPANNQLGICGTPPPGVSAVPGMIYIQEASLSLDKELIPWKDTTATISSIIIDSRQATKITRTINGTLTTLYVIDIPSGNTLQIKYTGLPSDKNYLTVFETMVSTFKFLD